MLIVPNGHIEGVIVAFIADGVSRRGRSSSTCRTTRWIFPWASTAYMDSGRNLAITIYWCIKTCLNEAFMPAWNDPSSLIHRLEAVLLRLVADMPIWNESVTLVLRLETTLNRLEVENLEHPGSCCSCHQDVPTKGHHPTCAIAQDLQAIRDWKRLFIPGGNWN